MDYLQPNEAGCGVCHFVEISGLTSAKDRIADLTQSDQILERGPHQELGDIWLRWTSDRPP